ncbi:MAG: hypothetical protein Q8M03_11410, partial [Legionella sp.]|nr:hypothetical protein [Legionella sp.]
TYDRTPSAVYAAAPQLGQHTEWVLREVLGKSEAEIAALNAAGVLENTPEEVLKQREAQAKAQ